MELALKILTPNLRGEPLETEGNLNNLFIATIVHYSLLGLFILHDGSDWSAIQIIRTDLCRAIVLQKSIRIKPLQCPGSCYVKPKYLYDSVADANLRPFTSIYNFAASKTKGSNSKTLAANITLFIYIHALQQQTLTEIKINE